MAVVHQHSNEPYIQAFLPDKFTKARRKGKDVLLETTNLDPKSMTKEEFTNWIRLSISNFPANQPKFTYKFWSNVNNKAILPLAALFAIIYISATSKEDLDTLDTVMNRDENLEYSISWIDTLAMCQNAHIDPKIIKSKTVKKKKRKGGKNAPKTTIEASPNEKPKENVSTIEKEVLIENARHRPFSMIYARGAISLHHRNQTGEETFKAMEKFIFAPVQALVEALMDLLVQSHVKGNVTFASGYIHIQHVIYREIMAFLQTHGFCIGVAGSLKLKIPVLYKLLVQQNVTSEYCVLDCGTTHQYMTNFPMLIAVLVHLIKRGDVLWITQDAIASKFRKETWSLIREKKYKRWCDYIRIVFSWKKGDSYTKLSITKLLNSLLFLVDEPIHLDKKFHSHSLAEETIQLINASLEPAFGNVAYMDSLLKQSKSKTDKVAKKKTWLERSVVKKLGINDEFEGSTEDVEDVISKVPAVAHEYYQKAGVLALNTILLHIDKENAGIEEDDEALVEEARWDPKKYLCGNFGKEYIDAQEVIAKNNNKEFKGIYP